jgi:LuxR family transcriptional regulator, maltose regulon positive regulatory protein
MTIAGAERHLLDHLSAGRDALGRGAWEEARAWFGAALQETETPEALEGLSWAAWWLSDAEVLFDARLRAYRLYRAEDDRRGAARMAMWLASDHVDFRGELAIASGWRWRARRLLENLDPCPEHGWLFLIEGAFAVEVQDDPATGRQLGGLASELGRRLGVIDLEMLGLAMEGLALVTEGQVDEGMRRLDEATAAALAGELEEIYSVPWVCCYLIYACERVRDYGRAAQWCEQMREYARRFQIRCVLGTCHAHYAGVMLWRGTWQEAESELAEAAEDLLASRPPFVTEAVVRLAELRRRQGRLAEAVELFEQAEGHPLSFLGRAELALDQGRPREASDLVDRYLRHLPVENKTQRAAALELLVRLQAALGDHAEAASTLDALQSISTAIATAPLQGSSLFAEGVLAAASGNYEKARRCLEDAVELFGRSGAPYETARARLELAGVLSALGRSDAAQKEARAAHGVFQSIGATSQAARADALLQTVVSARREPALDAPTAGRLTPREVEVLRLVAQGQGDREIAVQLVVSEHTVHRHIANILAKLNLPSRAAAVAHAAKHGLI